MIFDVVAEYTAANAQHVNKGWRLNEIEDDWILRYAVGEIEELRKSPDDIDEMADVFGCLVHYAQRRGWTLDQIEEALVKKLTLRFRR